MNLSKFFDKVKSVKSSGLNEEETKNSLVVPLLQALDWDITSLSDVRAELPLDIGVKQSERIDYALMGGGKPAVLIECKRQGATLNKYISQLYRYYTTSAAGIGILTNGFEYCFYTDIETENIMDRTPFWCLDVRTPSNLDILFLRAFQRSNFKIARTKQMLLFMRSAKALVQLSIETMNIVNGCSYDSHVWREMFEKLICAGSLIPEKYISLGIEAAMQSVISDNLDEVEELSQENEEVEFDGMPGASEEQESKGTLEKLAQELTTSDMTEGIGECSEMSSTTVKAKRASNQALVKAVLAAEACPVQIPLTMTFDAGRVATATLLKSGDVVIQAGSALSPTIAKYVESNKSLYEKCLDIRKHSKRGILKSNMLAASVSTAGTLVTGHSCNGLSCWKVGDVSLIDYLCSLATDVLHIDMSKLGSVTKS